MGIPRLYRPEVWESALQTSIPLCCAMQELLDTLRQEKLSLEQSVSALQANVSKLEEQARELKERERLLVFFPELHVPTEMQFESKGEGSGQQHLLLPQWACAFGVS